VNRGIKLDLVKSIINDNKNNCNDKS